MDDRKSRVLQAIIEDYVSTAEPVGSRTLARKYHLGVSPATIRNEMSDLEEMGYLEQPHTSAGRIPSSLGYRYFVDFLMEVREPVAEEERRISEAFRRRLSEVEWLIQQTARLLSDLTNYTSIVAGPEFKEAAFYRLEVLPLEDGRALLLLVTDTGIVEKQMVDLPEGVSPDDLQRFSRLINRHLGGQSIDCIASSNLRELEFELRHYRALLLQMLEFLESAAREAEHRRFYLGGAPNILGQPEFRDATKAKGLLESLQREDVMAQILACDRDDRSSPVSISIGEEIKYKEFTDCSVITATYRIGGKTVGRVGVLGPRRMEYARVVALVDRVARELSDLFGRR